MADQVTTATKGVQDKVQSTTTGAQQKVQTLTTGLLAWIEGWGGKIAAWAQSLLDRFWPPEARASFLAKIQAFMLKNPKLATFLGMNIALTGIPLFLFILFTLVVAIFSLLVGLILGVLAAVLTTVFAVGTALLVLLPTVAFTTGAACFLFLWGLGGYYILRWANGGEKEAQQKAGEDGGASVGDKLNSVTGGRMTGFLDQAKAERAKGGIEGFSDEYTKPKTPPKKEEKEKAHAQPNGSVEKQDVGISDVSDATKVTGVDGVQKTGANVTGTVKGGLGGATGLVAA